MPIIFTVYYAWSIYMRQNIENRVKYDIILTRTQDWVNTFFNDLYVLILFLYGLCILYH